MSVCVGVCVADVWRVGVHPEKAIDLFTFVKYTATIIVVNT